MNTERTPATCSTCGEQAHAPYKVIIAGRIDRACICKCHEAHIIPSTGYAHWYAKGRKGLASMRKASGFEGVYCAAYNEQLAACGKKARVA